MQSLLKDHAIDSKYPTVNRSVVYGFFVFEWELIKKYLYKEVYLFVYTRIKSVPVLFSYVSNTRMIVVDR